jgi:hypothetical protein
MAQWFLDAAEVVWRTVGGIIGARLVMAVDLNAAAFAPPIYSICLTARCRFAFDLSLRHKKGHIVKPIYRPASESLQVPPESTVVCSGSIGVHPAADGNCPKAACEAIV